MQERERKRRKWQKAQNPGSTPRRRCAVECDGLCGGERACEGLRRKGAEGESGIRGCSLGLIMTARPWQRLLDTAASAPSPGRLPYCRTGSCSERSSPPVCPHEETLHCRGNPESPVLTHAHTHTHPWAHLSSISSVIYSILLDQMQIIYTDKMFFILSMPWLRQYRNIEGKH